MGIAFLEAAAFLTAITLVLSSLGDPVRIAGYAAGFALGNGLGITMVRVLNLGNVNLRIFSPDDSPGLAGALRTAGFRLTVFSAEGRDGPVGMIMMLIRKRDPKKAMDVAKPWLPQAFVTVGEEPYGLAAGAIRK